MTNNRVNGCFQSEFFSSVLPDDIKLLEDEKILIFSHDYLKELDKLIGQTDERTLINFMMWRIADFYSSPLGIADDYLNDTRSRQEVCFDFAFWNLHLSLNADWVRHFVNKNAKREATKIVNSVKEELEKVLQSIDWLDEDTRQAALFKLKNMESVVAYPDEFFDDELLTKAYENVTIDESKLLETVLELEKFYHYEWFKDLRKPIIRNHWRAFSHVSIVNAFYIAVQNTIRMTFKLSNFFELFKSFQFQNLTPASFRAIFSTHRGQMTPD